jgi:hypothetical protein
MRHPARRVCPNSPIKTDSSVEKESSSNGFIPSLVRESVFIIILANQSLSAASYAAG